MAAADMERPGDNTPGAEVIRRSELIFQRQLDIPPVPSTRDEAECRVRHATDRQVKDRMVQDVERLRTEGEGALLAYNERFVYREIKAESGGAPQSIESEISVP